MLWRKRVIPRGASEEGYLKPYRSLFEVVPETALNFQKEHQKFSRLENKGESRLL